MGLEQNNKVFIATFFNDKNEKLSTLIEKLKLLNFCNLKITPSDKIHLTWKYIGEINPIENKTIFQIVKKHSDIIKKASLVFDKLEIWPNKRNPRLLALTARNFDDKIKDFVNRIEEDLQQELNIKKDKSFTPHLTIARIKSRRETNLLKKIAAEPIELNINHISLVQSVNESNQVVYKSIFEQPVL